MASVSKLARDRRKKNAPYYIQFFDHEGNRRTTKGCSDKGVSEAKAAKIETLIEKIKMGVAEVAELNAILGRPDSEDFDQYITDFKKSLTRKKNTEKHVKLTISRIKLVIGGCGFTSLNDGNADAVETFLTDYSEKQGLGHRTYNHYLQAIESFGNWLAHPKRRVLDHNPFAGIPRRNAATDVRHQRRALTTEEITKVIETSRQSSYTVQGYDGEKRSRLYLLSYMTGLRKGELASLTPRSFDLGSPQPALTIDATASKSRRRDTLPLHADLVAIVQAWITGMTDEQPLFPKLARKKTYFMIRRDLEEAGIDYKTEDGIADFHAAGRHSHITGLLRSGVKLVDAQKLARHTDIRMTMKYTHIGLDDQAKAVNQLPAIPPPKSEAAGKCLHIVCTESGADGQSGASRGSDRQKQQPKETRRNPNDDKGFGAVRQPVSPTGNNRQKVEAAGIEPASRDISTQASTCVVV